MSRASPTAEGAGALVRPGRGLAPLALALAAASVAVALAGDGAAASLRYERAGLADGQLWRLLTAHLVHLGTAHLLLNLAGLAIVTLWLGRLAPTAAWAAVAAASAVGVGGGLWAMNPAVAWYVGLSGVLHGLITAGAVWLARSERGVALATLTGLAAKLAWEQWRGPLPGTSPLVGGATIVDAHLYGAAAALLAVVGLAALRRR